MELHVARRHLGRWLDVRPRALVGDADGAGGDWPCDVWVYRPGAGADLGCVYPAGSAPGADEPLAAVLQPPAAVCVFAARSEAGRVELERLRAWWAGSGPGKPPEVCCLAGEDGSGVALTVLRRVRAELADAAGQQMALAGELEEMRGEAGLIRSARGGLQTHLLRLGQQPELVFSLPPGEDSVLLQGATESVAQPLPAAAEGLAALDLYRVGTDEGAGSFRIALHDQETAAELCSWTIPGNRRAEGWCRCVLPAALLASLHHLEVVVTAHSAQRPAPRLALAPVGPWTELSAHAAGRPLGQGLALLAWAVAPGSLWPRAGAPGRPGVFDYALAGHDLAHVRPTAHVPYPYFQLLHGEVGFRLNPLGPSPSTAVLPGACLPGTEQVVAVARVSGPGARHPVEYGLCLTEPGRTWAGEEAGVLAFSGWQAVPADGLPHVVALTLAQPPALAADLHLATRMPGDRPPWDHWADWLEVRLRLRHGGVILADGCRERPRLAG